MLTLSDILLYPITLVTAFVVTYLLVPLLTKMAPRLGLIDEPGERRVHTRPVPRCGGIAVFLGIHAACLLLFFWPYMPAYNGVLTGGWWIKFFTLTLAVLVLGVGDDRFDINAWLKLAGQVAIALVAFGWGFNAGMLFNVPLPVPVDMLATVFWFVAVMNAFNLIDGMDGVAGGLGLIAAVAIAGQALLQGRTGDALIPLALAVSCAAFLRYNFHPASIFLGDGGSMLIGFSVAALGLSLSAKSTTVVALAIPILAVGVPFFDTFLAIWRRSVRKLGDSEENGQIFGADADHLHHRLLQRGLSQRQVALVMYGLACLLLVAGFGSIFLRSSSIALYLIAFIAAVYVIVRHLAYVEMWHSTEAIRRGLLRVPRKATGVAFYVIMDLLILACALTVAIVFGDQVSLLGEWKERFVALAPAWIGIPFVVLVLSKAYRRVWSRARVVEFLCLVGGLFLGVVLACFVQEMQSLAKHQNEGAFAFVFAGVTAPLICGLRVFPRMVMEFASMVRPEHENMREVSSRRTLVYGAGQECTLYLRARALGTLHGDIVHRHFVGLLDDDANLHGRVVHGLKVLGGRQCLEAVVNKHGVEDLVLTVPPDGLLKRQIDELYLHTPTLGVIQWFMGVRPFQAAEIDSQQEETGEASTTGQSAPDGQAPQPTTKLSPVP